MQHHCCFSCTEKSCAGDSTDCLRQVASYARFAQFFRYFFSGGKAPGHRATMAIPSIRPHAIKSLDVLPGIGHVVGVVQQFHVLRGDGAFFY